MQRWSMREISGIAASVSGQMLDAATERSLQSAVCLDDPAAGGQEVSEAGVVAGVIWRTRSGSLFPCEAR